MLISRPYQNPVWANLVEPTFHSLRRTTRAVLALPSAGITCYMSVAREQPPVERIVRPFQDFAQKQSSGGILLIAATMVALVWASSPWSESYAALWHTKLTVSTGDFSISKDLTHWINYGIMEIFFLVVGLEIKREVLPWEGAFCQGRRGGLAAVESNGFECPSHAMLPSAQSVSPLSSVALCIG